LGGGGAAKRRNEQTRQPSVSVAKHQCRSSATAVAQSAAPHITPAQELRTRTGMPPHLLVLQKILRNSVAAWGGGQTSTLCPRCMRSRSALTMKTICLWIFWQSLSHRCSSHLRPPSPPPLSKLWRYNLLLIIIAIGVNGVNSCDGEIIIRITQPPTNIEIGLEIQHL
jgi:hypothetical protein